MKGLVRAAPTIERIRVGSRSARKHYGYEVFDLYDASKGHLASRWYVYMLLGSFALIVRNSEWDSFAGAQMLHVMSWIIKKVKMGTCSKVSSTKM